MKRYFALIAMIFSIITLEGQTILPKDSLIKSIVKNGYNSGYYTKYSHEKISLDNLPQPRGKDNSIAEIINVKLNSTEKLNQIIQKIFTSEQAKYLAENKCYFSSILYSTGKIISVTITFSNNDPIIDRRLLIEFIEQIKENLSFDISFDREVKKAGYVLLTHPAFPSLMTANPPKVKP